MEHIIIETGALECQLKYIWKSPVLCENTQTSVVHNAFVHIFVSVLES